MKTHLLIPAAGRGVRFGTETPKALHPIDGVPLVVRALQAFESAGRLENLILVCALDEQPLFEACLSEFFPRLSPTFTPGGAVRQDSVRRGLSAIEEDAGMVFIHDAARPFIQPDTIEAVFAAAEHAGAATVAIPAIDTILEADVAGLLKCTPDRGSMWQCQTPQVFRVELIRAAHEWAHRESIQGTDDATLVRMQGHPVQLVTGTRFNLKVTEPEDAALAEWLVRENLV